MNKLIIANIYSNVRRPRLICCEEHKVTSSRLTYRNTCVKLPVSPMG